MSTVTLKGTPINLAGNFPKVGDIVSGFTLTANDLSDVNLQDFKNHRFVILNVFPSIDTAVCANSVRKFNQEAADKHNVAVLCISKDLPFAQGRFCGVENIKNAKTLSAFRSPEFAKQFGVDIVDGPIRGLLARSVIVLDSSLKVVYAELVPEITQEPNYAQCLSYIAQHV